MTSTDQDTEILPRTETPPPPPDLTEAIEAAAPRRWWNRTTIALLGVALLAGGFLGGVQAQERWGTDETSSLPERLPGGAGMPSGLPRGGQSAAPGAADPAGAPGPAAGAAGPAAADPAAPGAAGPAAAGTAGTVKLVDGKTLYLQTAAGETVTVRTTDTTTVKVTQLSALSSLTPGQQVTIAGTPDEEGILNATAVTAG
ncbi:hypothetical protein [Actinoplanes sp. GCM10030250]|uniref:hypothetical protein n=1 Tax=Actinoplanes sp. GCM10030250 TaxID=3273376 RepID=UPI003607965C